MGGPDRQRERQYYRDTERARYYDERTSRGTSVERQRLAARTVGKYLRTGQVLDIGCGSARMLIEMARELGSLRFTGIDVSAEMIRIARENITRASLQGTIELRTMAAEDIGMFPDGAFDMVMSHGSFSGWLEPEEALGHVRRLLRPGGYLFLRDWCRSAPREALAPYLDSAGGNPGHLERIEAAYSSSYTMEEMQRLLSLEAMKTLEFGLDGLWLTALLRKT